MFLPRFELHRPRELGEAVQLLDVHGDEDPVVYLGGTELLLLMKLGLASPGHLVDAKRVDELHGISYDERAVTIGAATTHRRIELDPELARELPALPAMARDVANVRVRNAGTLGGNLCFAEPHSDPGTLLTALAAVLELVSSRGVREVEAEHFVTGPLTTVREPDEILVRVRIPRPTDPGRVRYRRLAFRERPVVGVAAVVDEHLRLVVGAVGPRPTLIGDGRLPPPGTAAEVHEVALAAADEVDPVPDADGSIDYKRHLTAVLVERTLRGLTA